MTTNQQLLKALQESTKAYREEKEQFRLAFKKAKDVIKELTGSKLSYADEDGEGILANKALRFDGTAERKMEVNLVVHIEDPQTQDYAAITLLFELRPVDGLIAMNFVGEHEYALNVQDGKASFAPDDGEEKVFRDHALKYLLAQLSTPLHVPPPGSRRD